MNRDIVINDVLTAIAFVVFDDTSSKIGKFNGKFVPAKEQEMGLNDMWHMLNDIEAKLCQINTRYCLLDLDREDAKELMKSDCFDICIHITKKIMQLQITKTVADEALGHIVKKFSA